MASDIFGMACPTLLANVPDMPGLEIMPTLMLLSAYLKCSERTAGNPLPKMCGAMDGGAQALMDELVAFFGRGFPAVQPP